MTEEPDSVTQAVPAHLCEQLEQADSDLRKASLEHKAAKDQAKSAKAHLDDCQSLFNAAARSIVHPPEDGFPETTPMAGLSDDTPPDEDAPDEPAEPADPTEADVLDDDSFED